MQNWKNLEVFQKADELVLHVYRVTKGFPSEERFGLAAHLRKTAMSIPSNIAEGCGRQGKRELFNFLNIAQGSANELDYQLSLAYRLSYIVESEYHSMNDSLSRVCKMLTALMKSVAGKSLDIS